MKNTDKRIPEDIAPEVLELASRYYAESIQGYSSSELVAAGREVNIPAELIEKAIQDVEAKRRQEQLERDTSRRLHRKFQLLGAGAIAVVGIWTGWTYNSLQSSRVAVEGAWAQVENQLQRRADLLPNLVSVTQSYAQQEKDIVTLLTRSRKSYLQARDRSDKIAATAEIDRAIAKFQKYAVANPELRASQLFANLQYEITGTENRLAVERRRYNQAVQSYNQEVESFPNVLVANTFGFDRAAFFQATNTQVPVVGN